MAADSEWISWAEAAQITGVPVHVIEWWKRQGRIEHRPEDKMRPRLHRARAAKIEFRQAQREDARWQTLVEAALVIGCDPSRSAATSALANSSPGISTEGRP